MKRFCYRSSELAALFLLQAWHKGGRWYHPLERLSGVRINRLHKPPPADEYD